MNDTEKFQLLINEFGKKQYKGVYLYRYIEDYMPTYIRFSMDAEAGHDTLMRGDGIPKADADCAKTVTDAIESMEQKDILFVMLQVRRPYKGKLVHTVFDSYISEIEDDRYTVLEVGGYPTGGGNLITKNRVFADIWGVVRCYGEEEVDRDELMSFIAREYIAPIEKVFEITFDKECLLSLYFRCSAAMKLRSAYIKFYGEVINKAKPKVICYTHGGDQTLQFLREAALMAGIRTVEIEHGAAIRKVCYPVSLRYADVLFTYSDMLTLPSRANGWKNIFTVGKPDRYTVEKSNKIENVTVVSFISSIEPGLYEMAVHMADMLAENGIYVMYKLHSSESQNKYNVADTRSNFAYVSGGEDVRSVYEMSDIVVGRISTALVDALPFANVKIVAISGKREKEYLQSDFGFLNRLAELGDIITVGGEEELIDEILSYEKGKKYRGEVNHFWPADSGERFRRYMDEIVEGTFELEEYDENGL